MKVYYILRIRKYFFTVLIIFNFSLCTNGQEFQTPYVGSVKRAQEEGIHIEQLDSMYRSAVNVADSSLAVFKTREMSDSLIGSYQKFLKGLGKYLRENHFEWGKETKCWNRIYFNADGRVDYYLFDFKTDVADEKTERFKKLFKSYASTHKINISAAVNFAQCGHVTFRDQ